MIQAFVARSRSLIVRNFSSAIPLLVGLSAIACNSPDATEPGIKVQLSALGKGANNQTTSDNGNADNNGKVSGGIGVIGSDGAPLDLSTSTVNVTVQTRDTGGEWASASDVVVDSSSAPLLDVVLVADNSGSVERDILTIRDALQHFSEVTLAREQQDRIGLVRVSTEASVVQGLTPDAQLADAAIDGLFVNSGWTALWDGVRLANEMLNSSQVRDAGSGTACFSGAVPSIIVITDGRENNSADEHPTSYSGDGIATTLEDILALHVGSVQTAVYTVGVGDRVDRAALQRIARETNGQYAAIRNYDALIGTLHGTAATMQALVPLCFRPAACSHTEVRVLVEVGQGSADRAEVVTRLPAGLCE